MATESCVEAFTQRVLPSMLMLSLEISIEINLMLQVSFILEIECIWHIAICCVILYIDCLLGIKHSRYFQCVISDFSWLLAVAETIEPLRLLSGLLIVPIGQCCCCRYCDHIVLFL